MMMIIIIIIIIIINVRHCGLSAELTSQLQVIQYIKHYIKAVGSG